MTKRNNIGWYNRLVRLPALALIAFSLVVRSGLCQEFDAARFEQRFSFATKVKKLELGKSEDHVRRVLGQPSTKFILKNQLRLCYGSTPKEPFPTIGHVVLDKSGRISARPNFEEPNRIEILRHFDDENELQQWIRFVSEVQPLYIGRRSDPRKMIEQANKLLPLGKDKIIVLLTEYLRVAPAEDENHEGVMLLARTLFDLPVGKSYDLLSTPMDTRFWKQVHVRKGELVMRRWPIVVIDGIPFNFLDQISFTGEGPTAEKTLARCSQYGVLRKESWKPTNQPAIAVKRFIKENHWMFEEAGFANRLVLLNQLLTMTKTASRSTLEFKDDRILRNEAEARELFSRVLERLSTIPMIWNKDLNDYQVAH